MRNTSVFILLISLPLVASAQVFQQAWRGGGVSADRVTSLAHMPDGGFVAGGILSDSSELAGQNVGDLRAFVARFDAIGDLLWIVPAGMASSYLSNAAPLVAVTAGGHIIAAGHYGPGMQVGDSVLQAPAPGNFYLAEFDMDGVMLWLRAAGTGGVRTTGLALDTQGNIVVAGLFSGTVDVGGTALTAFGSGNADIFTARFDPPGDLLWVRQAGGGGWYGDAANDVATDGSDNVIICGKIRNISQFDSITLPCTILSPDCSGGFVAKYDANGAIQWAKNAGMDCRGVAADAAGNVYITGDRIFNVVFDTIAVAGHNGTDHYTAKLDPSGNYQWVMAPTAGDMEWPEDIAVDQNGTSYVTGYYTGNMVLDGFPAPGDNHSDLFLYAIDTDGQVLWLRHGLVTAPAIATGYAVAVDNDCGLLVGGEFRNTPDFVLDGIDLGAAPSVSDLWFARMDACALTTSIAPYTPPATLPYLYPVPATDQLRMAALSGTFMFTVMDPRGSILLQGRSDAQGSISVSALAPGAYCLLLVMDDGNQHVLRFIKQ